MWRGDVMREPQQADERAHSRSRSAHDRGDVQRREAARRGRANNSTGDHSGQRHASTPQSLRLPARIRASHPHPHRRHPGKAETRNLAHDPIRV